MTPLKAEHVNDLYRDVIGVVMSCGQDIDGRNGGTIQLTDVSIRTDFSHGFPIITQRKIYPEQTIGEYVSFMNGCDRMSEFVANGCTFWGKNFAAESWQKELNGIREDTGGTIPQDWLGDIYGVQWRRYQGQYDQMAALIKGIQF